MEFIKKIKDKENGKASEDALKLIVKISEGSVRDALSLLDRALLALENGEELSLTTAQKIFGRFDKSQLIDLFKLILQGEEKKVIESYQKIYDQGVEPKVFINDFLELLYYFKNIELLTLESTNFSLNDEEFLEIKNISNKVDKNLLILFWQFTIRTLEELDIVSNKNLSIEMFLMRLMYLISSKSQNNELIKDNLSNPINKQDLVTNFKNDAVDQIKNVSQEKKIKPDNQTEIKAQEKLFVNSFKDLLNICNEKREIKLKHELENNVNIVSFDKNRLDISFNENLDKNFVKDLSSKLFEWTSERWIISFSKKKGEISIKEKEKNKKKELIKKAQDSELYKNVLKKFPDANLTDIIMKIEKED